MQPDPLWPQLLLQIILLLVTAFFAATEAALTGLNDNLLRERGESGDKKAERLLKMLEKPTRFRITVQLGITLTGFLAAGFAARAFAPRIAQWVTGLCPSASRSIADIIGVAATVASAAVLALLTLLLGVLLPRRLAMENPERVAGATGRLFSVFFALLRPAVWLLAAGTKGLLRLAHIDPDAEPEQVSEEGIRMLVDIGEEKGAIESGEKEMIENIFEFNNMTAEDVMIHRTDVVMLWADDTDDEIVHTIEETGLSRYPVYEEDADDVIGTLNSRDYFLNARRPEPRPVRELLRPAYFVPESVRTDLLFRDMQEKKVHLAIVVDEYGGTSGIITMEDLLEEIVGNIYDEFDPQDEQEIIALSPGVWRIAGSAELEEVAEALGIDLDEEEAEYDTLGGLVFAQLSVIPEDGSHPEVEVCGLHIEVEQLADRRVEWAVVRKLAGDAER